MPEQPQTIICPKCHLEIIPHGNEIVPHKRIRIDRLKECLVIAKELVPVLTEIAALCGADTTASSFLQGRFEIYRSAVELAKTLYIELNDFEISENIQRSKLQTTRYIAKTKKDNIKAMQK